MTDDFLNAIFTIVDFAVDLSETIDSTKRSKPDIVEVPPDPTAPPPGAQRALAEVEAGARGCHGGQNVVAASFLG